MTDERLLSTVRHEDGAAVVHVEDVYVASVDDLWSAITDRAWLARWIAEVDGELRPGGALGLRFTGSWTGTGEVLACEAPLRLVVATREEDGSETVITAVVEGVGDGTRLTVEDRGIPIEAAPDHAAGWQVHLEDLRAVLAGQDAGDWAARWRELIPAYRPDPARPEDAAGGGVA